MSVSGGCVDKQVVVTTDRDSIVIFRMNSGTPIFSEASPTNPAYYIPRVTGVLNITAIADGERVHRNIEISTCIPSTGTGTKKILPYGTFTVLGKEVEWRTAYGALKKASEIKGFTITPELTEWGIFVKCIKGVCSGDMGETSGWMYWVDYPDKPLPGVAATDYRIYPGNEVVWYFSRSMSETPDTSPYKIYITIGDEYDISVRIVWLSKIPPYPEFTFNPENPLVGEEITFNASKSYDDGKIVSYIWDFGDGEKGNGMVVTHIYTQPGTYRVTLTVVDDDNLISSISKNVTVLPKQIILNTTYPIIVKPGENVTITIPENITANLSIMGLKLEKVDKPVKVSLSHSSPPPGLIYGTFYKCFKLEMNASIRTEIKFRVPKNVVDEKKVVLMKFNGSWTELPTKKVGDDEYYAYYSAVTETFSVFAVTLMWENFPLNSSDERIVAALRWLKSVQNDDGGFANPGENSSIAKTSWAIMAIVASGQDPHEWVKNGKNPLDFIKNNLKKEIGKMGTADYARTILALVYAGENPRNFAGVNLVDKLKSKIKENGQIGDFVYTTIWGILALKAADENVSKSAEWLKAQQNPDGGFSWSVGKESDFDDTAAAIQALIVAGEPKNSNCILKAVEYLKEGQNDDGGMRYFGSSASNAASDAWTIQALTAAGINPMEWVKNNHSVVEHLLSLQSEEGYFNYTAYQRSNPLYMTVSAIMALLGKPHPIKTGEQNNQTPLTTTVSVVATTPTITATTTTTTTTANVTAVEFRKTPGFEAIHAIIILTTATAVAALRGWRK